MRKLFLTMIAVMAFVFTSTAQCDSQSTQVTSSCGISGCFSVQIHLTGSLESDVAIANATNGTFRRPLNFREAVMVANALEELC